MNGEPQKRAAEILAETAVALTLSQLHPEPGMCFVSVYLSPFVPLVNMLWFVESAPHTAA